MSRSNVSSSVFMSKTDSTFTNNSTSSKEDDEDLMAVVLEKDLFVAESFLDPQASATKLQRAATDSQYYGRRSFYHHDDPFKTTKQSHMSFVPVPERPVQRASVVNEAEPEISESFEYGLKDSHLHRSTSNSQVLLRQRLGGSLGRAKTKQYAITSQQLQDKIVSIQGSLAAFVLVLHNAFPQMKTFRIDVWVTRGDGSVTGGKLLVPVRPSAPLTQLITHINFALIDLNLVTVNLEGALLDLQWSEKGSNHIETYPLNLPDEKDVFLRYQMHGFYKGCKWDQVDINHRKGTVYDMPPDSPLPDFIGHFKQVLSEFTSAPRALVYSTVSDIQVLPPDEYNRLMTGFSNLSTFQKLPKLNGKQPFLSSIFTTIAKKYPKRPALVCGPTTWSYAELLQVSRMIAATLIHDYNVKPNDTVMLMLPRDKAGSFACILGVIMAGAAYVPVDWQKAPLDRCSFIIKDCNCKVAIVTDEKVRDKLRPMCLDSSCAIVSGQDINTQIRTKPRKFDESKIKRSPEDMAYIIYTSGTTGKPKGVVVMQYNVAYLVLCEKEVYGVKHTDRSYQNASHSFDFSVEEIWVCWAAGAALVAPTTEMLIAGPDLPELLEEAGITIFSCVPTHLSILARDIEGVRIIIMGGEAAQESALNRFRRPGRKIYNTYGPTETTITATYLDISEPVAQMTIGHALPGFTSYIIEPETRKMLPHGGMGELVIGGECVTQGYLNRDDLTNKSFYPNNFQQTMPHWGNPKQYPRNDRLYKSGDLCRFTFDGRIEYFGRIDCQVKLRGFRIELGEIESVLMECDNVNTAICHVWTEEDSEGVSVQTLCAYLVLTDSNAPFDELEIKDKIGEKLATYMVPSAFVLLEAKEVPRLPSGKVDRKNLVKPNIQEEVSDSDGDTAEDIAAESDGSIASTILVIWKKAFSNPDVGMEDDFFRDLGGHSLLAARIISTMRQNPDLAGVGVKDLYHSSTVNAMAAFIETKNGGKKKSGDAAKNGGRPSTGDPFIDEFQSLPYNDPGWRYWVVSFFQLISFYPIVMIQAIPMLTSVLGAFELVDFFFPLLPEFLPWQFSFVLLMFMGYFGGRIVQLLLVLLLKALLIGKYEECIFKIYSLYYFRWWLTGALLDTVNLDDMHGTPLINFFFRLLGAKIAGGAHIHTSHINCLDLLTVESGANVGFESIIHGYEVRNGYIRCGKTFIGKNVTIGAHCVVSPGTTFEEDCSLGELSHVAPGTTIPEAELWMGSPAIKINDERNVLMKVQKSSFVRRFFFCLGLIFAWFFLLLFNSLLSWPFFATSYLLIELDLFGLKYFWPLIISFPATTVGIMFFLLMGVALKWMVIGRMKAGTFPIDGAYYIRYWMFSAMFASAIKNLRNLFSTLYLPPWLRMLGSKVGRNSECSFFAPMNCELMELGDGVFVADGVCTAPPLFSRGRMTIGSLKVGNKSFLGNQSVVPPNTIVEDDCLLGVDSAPPYAKGGYKIPRGETWLGNAPVQIPQREVLNDSFEDEQTYRPSGFVVFTRLIWEYFRIVIPVVINGLVFYGEFLFLVLRKDELDMEFWQKIIIFPLLVMVSWILISFFVIALKWVFIGTYVPVNAPLFSSFVRRTELCCGIQEQLTGEAFLKLWRGTPLIGVFFRLFGAKIGKRVYFDSYDITEHDLVEIGDYSTLGPNATLQTHLFEDRVMKLGPIEVGKYCNIGTRTTILYDTKLGENVDIQPLSLVMKGEEIPNGVWGGLPVSHQYS